MIVRQLILDFQQGAVGGSELRGKGVEAKWKKVLGVSMAIGRFPSFPSFWGILGYSWLYFFILGYSRFILGYSSQAHGHLQGEDSEQLLKCLLTSKLDWICLEVLLIVQCTIHDTAKSMAAAKPYHLVPWSLVKAIC